MFDGFWAKQSHTNAGFSPVQTRPQLRHGFYEIGKRALDVSLVLLSAPITLPVVLGLAVVASLDGRSPFYLQSRIGRHGRLFRLWKLRTMVPDADARLAVYLDSDPAARAEWDAHQKLRRDPRLTRVGGLLRRYSLDELPQLWNVLRGDMSLVGPRPMMPEQRLLYPGTAYFDLRPGLTGLWQVSERNQCTFADRAAYDNRYAQSMSLRTDLRVIAQTFQVVLRGTGC